MVAKFGLWSLSGTVNVEGDVGISPTNGCGTSDSGLGAAVGGVAGGVVEGATLVVLADFEGLVAGVVVLGGVVGFVTVLDDWGFGALEVVDGAVAGFFVIGLAV